MAIKRDKSQYEMPWVEAFRLASPLNLLLDSSTDVTIEDFEGQEDL